MCLSLFQNRVALCQSHLLGPVLELGSRNPRYSCNTLLYHRTYPLRGGFTRTEREAEEAKEEGARGVEAFSCATKCELIEGGWQPHGCLQWHRETPEALRGMACGSGEEKGNGMEINAYRFLTDVPHTVG